jgi:phosphatidylserine/phosphatidylglycerophosphate/cardiolipin synthase-like enzyme
MPESNHEAAVAEFIRERGIARCPTACVLPTQGSIAAADRAALAEYAMARDRVRQAKSPPTHNSGPPMCHHQHRKMCLKSVRRAQNRPPTWMQTAVPANDRLRHRRSAGSGQGTRVYMRSTADKTAPCPATNGVELLAAAGVPFWIDGQAGIAHTKTMVTDGAVTLTGSMNWTRGPAANSENLNLVSSPDFAAAYAAHWRERLAVSVRYERRGDWCRVSSREVRLSARR